MLWLALFRLALFFAFRAEMVAFPPDIIALAKKISVELRQRKTAKDAEDTQMQNKVRGNVCVCVRSLVFVSC